MKLHRSSTTPDAPTPAGPVLTSPFHLGSEAEAEAAAQPVGDPPAASAGGPSVDPGAAPADPTPSTPAAVPVEPGSAVTRADRADALDLTAVAPAVPASAAPAAPVGSTPAPVVAGGDQAVPAPGFLSPAPPRLRAESALVRLVATAGVVGIGTAVGAILVANNVAGWITGLVVSLVSVILAGILWRSRRL